MRHTIHLFLGNSLVDSARALNRYVLKYGEPTVSPSINTVLWCLLYDYTTHFSYAFLDSQLTQV